MAHAVHKLIREFYIHGFRVRNDLARFRERQDPFLRDEGPQFGIGAHVELIKLDSLAYSSMSLAKDRKPPDRKELPPAALKADASTDPVFDRWLERKLHELFDAVAHEPIPDDLIQLIVTLDEKDKKRNP